MRGDASLSSSSRFALSSGLNVVDPDIPARPGKARDDARGNGVRRIRHYYGNGRRCPLRRVDRNSVGYEDVEAWHLLSDAARLDMMRWIDAGGAAMFEIDAGGAKRMLALPRKYRDRPMDITDASLVVLAERIGINEILTVDRADFDVYRLPGGRGFVQVL